MRTTDFLNSIGVNTHIGSDPYNEPVKLASMLSYLGAMNVRQSSPIDAPGLANMQKLGLLGASIDLIVNGGGPVDLAGAMATVKQLAPYLNAVEGVNEAVINPITYNNIKGVDAAAALQKDLYAAVKSDPALAHASVYMFTLGGVDPAAYPSLGDLSAYTDYANIHSYPPHGLRPIFVIHAAIDGGRTDAPSKPVVITETGYYTLPQNAGWGGVPESMQAAYTLGLLLDEAAAGVSRTYLYDLIDDGANPKQNNREDHFGLFHYDGTPKLAATAIHNMAAILADPEMSGQTFDPQDFAFTATGVPYNYTGNTLALQKSDGTRVVAVWNEEQLWNPDTQQAIPVQHFATEVTFPSPSDTVLVYDPLVGTRPVQTLHNASSVTLDLTDHPFFIVIPPASKGASLPGSGPATPSGLVLTMSEDAWLGDAQFTVSVDGQRVGPVQTVTSSHAAEQTQDISVTGVWSPGPHILGIGFINDAYGGTADQDRNLYVERIAYGGQASYRQDAQLFSDGAASFIMPGAGGGGLTLHLAEDAWQGDANVSVSIDGAQVAASEVVTALHASGEMQALTFAGVVGAGQHDVAVSFLNDAYGGSAATDRNLYVLGVDVNAVPIAGSSAALFSAGSAHFHIDVPSS